MASASRVSRFLACLFLSLCRQSLAQECDRSPPPPISIPVRNVTLDTGNLRRGLDFKYGSPPQQLALAVSGGWNSTYVYDETPQCGSVSVEECVSTRGGAFDEGRSSSWASFDSFSTLPNLDTINAANKDEWIAGTDTLSLGESVQVQDFPVAIPRADHTPFSQLGLGRASSLLTILRNKGTIASRSFSLFWGQTGSASRHQIDGALVIGGYDQAKIAGHNYTTSIASGTPCVSNMIIPVTDLTLEFPNGTSASLMTNNVGQSINYCLEPEFPLITMRREHWDSWVLADPVSATNGNAANRAGQPNLWGLLYPAGNVFQGDLRITIDSTLDLTIPNHQLVQQYYTFDRDGRQEVNTSVHELMINPLFDVNANDMPKLGMTFLQAAYLFVNYDTDKLTLWQAQITQKQYLVSVASSTNSCPSNSTSGSNVTGGVDLSNDESSNSTSLSGGAIAGIIVGVLACISGVSLAVWLSCVRRRRQGKTWPSNRTSVVGHLAPKAELEAPTQDSSTASTLTYATSSTTEKGKYDQGKTGQEMEPQELPAVRWD